jgi:hypothetical protein
MLMLFCVQVVQTNNNKYSFKILKIKKILVQTSQKEMQTCQKSKKSLLKKYN